MTVVLQTELVFRVQARWADIAAAGLVVRGGADVGIARMNSSIADLRARAQSVKHALADSTTDEGHRRKPISTDELVAAVRRCFERTRQG